MGIVRNLWLLPAAILVSLQVYAQDWEAGVAGGYGIYRNGTVFSPSGNATAGIRNRFVAGAVFAENRWDYVSAEVRYVYQDGDPFLSSGGQQANIQGQSHTGHYDLLIHFRKLGERFRPFVAVGGGAKWYRITGPANPQQPLSDIAQLTTQSQWRPLFTAGAGVKFQLTNYLQLRFDFRDYMTPFPDRIIQPAPSGTGRGILHQFTPMFGISYTFDYDGPW